METELNELLAKSGLAYEAELEGQFDNANGLHQAAIGALRKFTEKLCSSTEDQEQKRIATRKIDLHRERLETLRLASSGEVKPVSVDIPSLALAASDVLWSEQQPTLSFKEKQMPQTFDSSPSSFTSTLSSTLPAETYYIHQTIHQTISKQGFNRWYFYTVRDVLDKHTLYILEACMKPNTQIPYMKFYRAADYHTYCIRIVPTPVKPQSASNDVGSGFRGRVLTLHVDVLPQPIVETPDRIERQPWGPRRFTYGGRRFVWKVRDKSEDTRPETLYEYMQTSPKIGSKTGKKNDDALQTRLFWSDPLPLMSHGKFTVHCVGGLDQVFKEYLFASQITKLVCMYTAF